MDKLVMLQGTQAEATTVVGSIRVVKSTAGATYPMTFTTWDTVAVGMVDRMTLDSAGGVTIAGLGGGGAQDVGADNNGLLYVPFVSDRKFKDNIKPLAGALDTVLALRGVVFDWNKQALAKVGLDFGDSGQQVGMIAQEVKQVIPWAASDGKQYEAYDRGMITPYLVEAIKELAGKVEKLETIYNKGRNGKWI